MTLTGLDQFRKYPVLPQMKEIPPVKDEKGEITEVQVLEEGEIPGEVQVAVFDPDEFLDRLEQGQFQPQCPRCEVPMTYGSTQCSDGKTFDYYRCPTKYCGTNCYVTCAVDEVGDFLRCVQRQTHPCYKIDPARFRCDCDLSLVLATSYSVNNPDRFYLKCPGQTCKFFQWINELPRGLAKDILIDSDRISLMK